jgi:exonuclease SbcD
MDTRYARQSDAMRHQLQKAGRDALIRLVDLAISEQVDALLIVGDLFDNEWLTITTERILGEEMRRATSSGVTVVYATGNHDPGRANYRAMNINWPEQGFHLVRSHQPVEIPIERSGEIVGFVVAAGHQTKQDKSNLANSYPTAPRSAPAIAMLHTQVTGSTSVFEHEPYAPSTMADFEGKGYAYWALGHVHKRQTVSADPLVIYPGNLQGRDFGETGAKGALVVDLASGVLPETRFVPLAAVRWEVLALDDLARAQSIADIQTAASAAFEDLVTSETDLLADQKWILRVLLSGSCPLVDTLRRDDERNALAEYLCEALGVLDVEVRDAGLHRPLDLDEHRGQQHVLGVALDLVAGARTDDDSLEHLEPATVANGDVYPEGPERQGYLRELLEGIDMSVAEFLLREDRE